jgi:hypothetical protein
MSKYASMIAMAWRMLATKGAPCVWSKRTPVQDPAQPWLEVPAVAETYNTHIVVLPYETVARRVVGYVQGTTVPTGTLLGYVPGSTEFTPELRDMVTVGDETYGVAAIDIINPDSDEDVFYVVELRR